MDGPRAPDPRGGLHQPALGERGAAGRRVASAGRPSRGQAWALGVRGAWCVARGGPWRGLQEQQVEASGDGGWLGGPGPARLATPAVGVCSTLGGLCGLVSSFSTPSRRSAGLIWQESQCRT